MKTNTKILRERFERVEGSRNKSGVRDRLDWSLVGALLRKQRVERRFGFTKGNFDAVGFILRLVLVAVFVAVFVIFFGRFAAIYTTIKTNNVPDVTQRLYELLAIAYMFVLVLMTVNSVTAVVRELFLADDIKIFSAMPVGAKTLFVAKVVSIYRSQLLFALVTVLTVNISVALVVPQGVWFYIMTVLLCLVLPLVSIAIGSLLALPFYVIRQFLQPRFALLFIAVTLLAAVAFWLYSIVLTAVKELLLGDDLRYFFNAQVMETIRVTVTWLYPANWMACFLLRHEMVRSSIGIVLVLAVCTAVSMLVIRSILTRALQARISGDENFIYARQDVAPCRSIFATLFKKEFVQIFRTPSYMFSYFSVALLMPLMVYFCMEVGASLLTKLIGINCNLELALFLTLLFSALTNVFCSTNISREGMMFYSVKAQPITPKQIFMTKILFCVLVSVASQLISAFVLGIASYVAWPTALFIFGIGSIFSFAQICFATRYDFNHAHFSTEDDGEIKESGNTVSTIIVLGMVMAFLIGGAVLIVRMMIALRLNEVAQSFDYLSYVLVSVITVVVAVLSYLYLITRLNQKYYEFSGGGLM